MNLLHVQWLGRIAFADALTLQEELVAAKRADENAPDELLLLEHDPVYTIGRTPDRTSLLGATHLPHPLFSINRGGQATYHGPGQLIAYPIVDLRRCGQDLHKYLRWLEQVLIDFLAKYELAARRREGLTGVWIRALHGESSTGLATDERKIASIGVGVRHWITMHGVALNVCGDLAPFEAIVPCGISNVTMTSIQRETEKSISVSELANEFAIFVRPHFDDLRTKPEPLLA
jgi:lipoyl(octanoyl) transferase